MARASGCFDFDNWSGAESHRVNEAAQETQMLYQQKMSQGHFNVASQAAQVKNCTANRAHLAKNCVAVGKLFFTPKQYTCWTGTSF